jgi:hypothetical protein
MVEDRGHEVQRLEAVEIPLSLLFLRVEVSQLEVEDLEGYPELSLSLRDLFAGACTEERGDASGMLLVVE